MNTADFAMINQMSFEEFSTKSIRLCGVKEADFVELRDWCEANFSKEDQPTIAASEEKHGFWTVRATFLYGDAVKNAATFRMFWDH